MYRNYLVERLYVRRIRPWLTAKTILGIFKLQNIIDFILLIMTVRARLLASGLLFLHSWQIRKYIHTQKRNKHTSCFMVNSMNQRQGSQRTLFFSHLSQRIWPAANTNSWCNDIPKKCINFDDSQNYLQLKSKWKLKHFCFNGVRKQLIMKKHWVYCQRGSNLLTFCAGKRGHIAKRNNTFTVKCHTIKFISFG